MENEVNVQILTPAKKLFAGKASEVVLPAYDGEFGVLAKHSDFIGVLGTGALKIVTSGDDYWFMLSSGVYQVKNGELTILAEIGETPESSADIETLKARMKELEAEMADFKDFSSERHALLKKEYNQVRARVEVHRRTELVN